MTRFRFPQGVAVALALGAASLGHAGAARADTADACIASAERSQPLRRDGKLKAAREELIACSRPSCPSIIRTDCTKWLADVEALMPSIVVRAVDAVGTDVMGVRVYIDGAQQEASFEGKELDVDPGPHTLRVEHDGSAPFEQQIVVRESERHRMLSVALTPAASAAGEAAVRATSSTSPPADTGAAPTSSGRSLVLPIALIGVGGVGLAVASYFWASGLSDRSAMASSSGCATTHSCSQSQVDSARGKLVAGDVVGGAGLVAAAIGAGLLVFGGGHAPSDAPPVTLEPVPGGAHLQIRGRF